MQSPTHAFLIATHQLNRNVQQLYETVLKATPGMGATCILYHEKNEKPLPQSKYSIHTFTDAILTDLHYTPIASTLIPGSNHFSLLQYYLQHPQYDYYWYIENDVQFTGDWAGFFNAFRDYPSAMATTQIERYADNPSWPWWHTLHHPINKLPQEQQLKSFNPVYRLSNNALQFIHQALLNDWRGHHEVLLPSLLYNNNFSLMDFGGTGRFVPPGFRNQFYTWQTFRWRPIFKTAGTQHNKLYHPVK